MPQLKPAKNTSTSYQNEAVDNVVASVVAEVPMPPEDAEAEALEKGKPALYHVHSHTSGHDIPHVDNIYREIGDEVYEQFTPRKKVMIVSVMAFTSFLAPISSTTVLAAVPEVAETYATTGTVINLSNALYLLFMGLSPVFWGPLGSIYGRRWTQIISAIGFTAFSIGSALAPNLISFFIFRILTAFQGTSFLIIGASVIGDIYRPTERATALSWFFTGTLVGPAAGPLIGGILVTYSTWRTLFWFQTGLAAVATILCFFFLPETIHVSSECVVLNSSSVAN